MFCSLNAPTPESNVAFLFGIFCSYVQKRNKLSHARADKLVYCFSNLQLLVRATSSKYEDTKVEWTYADAEADASSEDSDNSSISEDSGSEAEGELLLLL